MQEELNNFKRNEV
jgi:hypothetical protein